MVPPDPIVLAPTADLARLPEMPAVYLIWPKEGQPYLARTNVLRRRLTRLMSKWHLDEVADRIEYWPTASRLEQAILSYALARRYFPHEYERILRLPKPPYVKLILTNQFPRTQITTRLSGGRSLYFGPFPNRASADHFEGQVLDLYQIRRCQEDLAVSPDHPGCIYGEMGRCLRPCQEVVTASEYAAEVHRVSEFLASRGASLIEITAASRDRFSEEMMFEEAARQHSRMEKIEEVVKLGGELAREVSSLHGVAVTRSTDASCVTLWFLRNGCWLDPRSLDLSPGLSEPLDRRLRELTASLEPPDVPERAGHLALLARWFYSSWRDGEWLIFDSPESVPYRKLVNAIHRVAVV